MQLTGPVWEAVAARTTRRGDFWEPPENVTGPYPIILVHGGAVQGAEWLDTPDGRPGWAQRLVDAGYAVIVVDRPIQGRSPLRPDEAWQCMDAARLADLLDTLGPAIVVTHSASGSDGWLLADAWPESVVAIVSVEPMGPPFGTTPGIGTLSWGLTAAPITYDPPGPRPRRHGPRTRPCPRCRSRRCVTCRSVVAGETSPQARYAPDVVRFVRTAGAAADLIHLRWLAALPDRTAGRPLEAAGGMVTGE